MELNKNSTNLSHRWHDSTHLPKFILWHDKGIARSAS